MSLLRVRGVRWVMASGLAVASVLAAVAAPRGDEAAAPATLSDTGLFVAGSLDRVAPDVLAFSPQYPLWSDGATKRRWLRLPPGTSIDASDPDAWVFPPGTRLWKEFSMGGRRVETRMIERRANGAWRFVAYVWNDAQTEAALAPERGIRALPVATAPGGHYAIPSEGDCRACHEGAPAPVLGFSALQLSPDRDPLAPHAERGVASAVDLRDLVERGLVKSLPRAMIDTPPRVIASSADERAVLGYLHGNCAHCHAAPDASGAAVPVDLVLAQSVKDPHGSSDRALASMLGVSSRFRASNASHPVVPGHPETSVLALRMRSRDSQTQMPPLGTALPDLDALVLVERWITHRPHPTKEPLQ